MNFNLFAFNHLHLDQNIIEANISHAIHDQFNH